MNLYTISNHKRFTPLALSILSFRKLQGSIYFQWILIVYHILTPCLFKFNYSLFQFRVCYVCPCKLLPFSGQCHLHLVFQLLNFLHKFCTNFFFLSCKFLFYFSFTTICHNFLYVFVNLLSWFCMLLLTLLLDLG